MTRLRTDQRGISIALTHALTIGITALLITVLLFSVGSMFSDQEERVVRSGLHDISDRTADELVTLDRLAGPNLRSNIGSNLRYPTQVGGSSYSIDLQNRSGTAVVYVNATNSAISVPTEIETESNICPAYQNGGWTRVYYNTTRACLTIGSVNK